MKAKRDSNCQDIVSVRVLQSKFSKTVKYCAYFKKFFIQICKDLLGLKRGLSKFKDLHSFKHTQGLYKPCI